MIRTVLRDFKLIEFLPLLLAKVAKMTTLQMMVMKMGRKQLINPTIGSTSKLFSAVRLYPGKQSRRDGSYEAPGLWSNDNANGQLMVNTHAAAINIFNFTIPI